MLQDEEDEKAPIQLLISELGDLLKFIQENKETVDVVLEEELKVQAGIEEEKEKEKEKQK